MRSRSKRKRHRNVGRFEEANSLLSKESRSPSIKSLNRRALLSLSARSSKLTAFSPFFVVRGKVKRLPSPSWGSHMKSKHKQREVLRRYLLGQLSERQRSEVAE